MRRRVLDPVEVHTFPPESYEEIYYILFGYEGDCHLLADNLNEMINFGFDRDDHFIYNYDFNSDRYRVITDISHSPITMNKLYSTRSEITFLGNGWGTITFSIEPSRTEGIYEYGSVEVYDVEASTSYDSLYIYDIDTGMRSQIVRGSSTYSFTWYLGKPILYLRLPTF